MLVEDYELCRRELLAGNAEFDLQLMWHGWVANMEYDDQLIEDAVLALLATYSSDTGNAWKGLDFVIMNRLHEHGFISDPVNKDKSIWVTDEGLARSRQKRLGDLNPIADRILPIRLDSFVD